MGPRQVLPLPVRVDLKGIEMKGYPVLARSPELEPHYQMHFSLIRRTTIF